MIEIDDIASIDGKDAIAVSGTKMPWHNKGVKIPGLMTPTQALIAGRCDYEVVKLSVGVVDDGATEYYGIQVPNTFTTGRIGPELMEDGVTPRFIPFEGSVKGRYHIVQNRDAFSFLEPALGKDIACIDTVGAMGRGERVWAMAKLPETFDAMPGDPIDCYILITNTHDGSGSVKACFTPIRVVCRNTLIMALSSATNVVSIRHTKSAKEKMKQLTNMLGMSKAFWPKLKDAYKTLQMRDMKQLEVIDFIETMFPGKREKIKAGGKMVEVTTVPTKTQNMRDAVLGLFNGLGQGSSMAGRSQWGMLNAYTEWLDGTSEDTTLQRSIRKTSDYWEASAFGSGVAKRQKAYNTLVGQLA